MLSGGIFFVPYTLMAQTAPWDRRWGKLQELLNPASLSFIHNLFMVTSVSVTSPLSVLHIHNFLRLLSTFQFLHSVAPSSIFLCLLPSLSSQSVHSTTLPLAFCLGKGRLLVPYQTLMNYQRLAVQSPGQKRTSLSVCLSVEHSQKGEVLQSSQQHLVL